MCSLGPVGLAATIVVAQVRQRKRGLGLLIYLARLLVRPDRGRLLPTAVVLGGIHLPAMNDVALEPDEQEMPIGLLTNAAGHQPARMRRGWSVAQGRARPQ